MERCPRAKELPRSIPNCTEPVIRLLNAVEALITDRADRLLSCCLSSHTGRSVVQVTKSSVAKLAKAVTDGSLASGSTLDDFLQLVPNGDRRCLTLLVLIDRIVDKLKHPRDRVQRLETAARRSHLLLPRDTLGDGEAAWKQAALRSVVHAEVSLLDEHVAACRDCTLLHRWRSWALSFVLLLPHERAVAAMDPSALASHALLAMLGDDSLDYAKDVAEGTGTLFTHLLGNGAAAGAGKSGSADDGSAKHAEGETPAAGGAGGGSASSAAAPAAGGSASSAAAAAAGVASEPVAAVAAPVDAVSPHARGIVSFLGGLLSYVAAVVATIKPGVPELAPGETSPGVEAAAALPAQLAAALGRPEVAGGSVNAVALRALLRLAIVLLHRAHDAGGRPAAELAWHTWFSSAGSEDGSGAGGAVCDGAAAASTASSASESAPAPASASSAPGLSAWDRASLDLDVDLDCVLSLRESSLAEADAVAMRACMAAPSIATDMAVLRALLTVPDEELGENPSAMTLLWTAALLPPEEGDRDGDGESHAARAAGAADAAGTAATVAVAAAAPSAAP